MRNRYIFAKRIHIYSILQKQLFPAGEIYDVLPPFISEKGIFIHSSTITPVSSAWKHLSILMNFITILPSSGRHL